MIEGFEGWRGTWVMRGEWLLACPLWPDCKSRSEQPEGGDMYMLQCVASKNNYLQCINISCYYV